MLAGPLLGQQHSYTPADVESGARLYQAHCLVCHGADGSLIQGVDLRRAQFRRGSSDEDLIRIISAGIPGTAMPPTNLIPPELWAVVAYLRSMRDFQSRPAAPGDQRRGQLLFEGNGGCLTCHRVKGTGSRLGPDLSDIGLIRSSVYLERSILEPNESILPQNRFVRAVTRGGTVITGRRLNEDTHTVQLLDSNERLVSLAKPDLRECTTLKDSPMPSYRGKFTTQELADVITYLASLKGADQP